MSGRLASAVAVAAEQRPSIRDVKFGRSLVATSGILRTSSETLGGLGSNIWGPIPNMGLPAICRPPALGAAVLATGFDVAATVAAGTRLPEFSTRPDLKARTAWAVVGRGPVGRDPDPEDSGLELDGRPDDVAFDVEATVASGSL